MTNRNNLLRRLSAMVLCICLLMSNMNVALSDTVLELISPAIKLSRFATPLSSTQQEVALSEYATLSSVLKADQEGTELPDVLEDGQQLFFQLAFELKTQENGAYLIRNGLVGADTVFTVDISFLNLIGSANYPTSYDDKDNIASDNGKNIFRWWVDEASGKICLRFEPDVFTDEGSLSNTKVAFEGTLDASGRDENGKLHFGVDGVTTSMIVRQDYKLEKAAGIPYYSTDASDYLVDYTVTLELKQNMALADGVSDELYSAALTLVDTVLENGALEGEIYGVPVVTAPEGESASVTVTPNGTTNTLTFASEDQILKQGTYTIVYKMKLDSAAALAKLKNYTDEQKKNTVEVKENGDSLPKPLTADATIAWNNVTEDQYKIDKNAFTEKAPHFKGVYLDEANKKYYIDFRVVVYIREEVSTFTVTDHADYALTFQGAPEPTLEGVDTSETYWTNDVSTATLTPLTGANEPTVESYINDAKELVTTITAPAGGKLQPGAYHLRVPADVTAAVNNTLEKTYPQSYQNTVHLTSVDNETTQESKMFKQAIPNRTEPRKDGGFVVENGQVVLHNGKPVIRWDVWIGWDFYDTTTFVDSMTGMELLIDDNKYRFEIHSFTDMNHIKEEKLVSLTTRADQTLNGKTYLDFNDAGNGFTFYAHNLDKNSDNTPVKMYKLVYFTTPADNADGTGYVTTGFKNSYSVTHKDPFGKGFGNPGTGEVEPSLTAAGRLFIAKKHIVEVNDLVTSWKITVTNTNDIPFSQFGHLDILDVIPADKNKEKIGEVTVYYSDEFPISVEMTMPGNLSATLEEGKHYTIAKSHPEHNLGDNGEYGFVVQLNMSEVAKLLAENHVTQFDTIQVTSYLQNERHGWGQNYRIFNDGCVDYSNLGVETFDYVNAYYDRGFSTKTKGEHPYDDFYNPNSYREFFVCNLDENGDPIGRQSFTGGYDFNPATGDGQKEIVWRIKIGAREFGNDDNPIQVTVTDTFSDNQMFPTYEGMELKDQFLIRAENDGYRDYIILPDSVSVDGNSFTLVFTVPGGGWAGGSKDNSKNITIDYHTILKPEAIKEAVDGAEEGKTSVRVAYHNTATVGWHGDSYTIPTTTSSAEFSTIMLDKTSKIVTAVSEIEYSILINQDRLPLNGGNPLVLTDTLGDGKENFLYRDDTVQLVNLDTGEALTAGSTVSDSTYTITWATGETKGFTISVPDAQRLQLTYRVKPQGAVGTTTDQLTNSASLDGQTTNHVQNSFKVNASNQEASYTPPEGTAAVSIRKLEGGSSVQILLQGAEFTVYPVLPDGTLGEACQTVTTDANGKAMFSFERNGDVGYDTVFCIKETKAPAGYQASNQEWYFYFSTSGKTYANDIVKSIVEMLQDDGKTVLQGMNEKEHTLNVENLPLTCDLRIYKRSPEGNSLEGAAFTLQDAKGNQMAAPTFVTEEGCYTFTDLKGGTYTLTETKAPDGYQLSTPNSWTILLEAGSEGKADSVSVVWPEDATDAMKTYVVAMASEAVPSLAVINDEADPVKLAIPVTKVLDGAETTQEAFTFTIEPVQDENEPQNVPMPIKATATTKDAVYANKSTQVFFGEITYTYDDIGTYQYQITENTAGAGSFTADTAVYLVTVKVEWKNDQLAASIASITKDGASADEVSFTNTYVPYTSATVTKVWEDDEDAAGMRPAELVVTLYADEKATEKKVTLNEGNNWTGTIEDLPKYADGKEIQYTWTEASMPSGYALTNTSEDGTVTTLTNTYTPELTSITVKKVWDDNGDQDGKRSGVVAKVTLQKTVNGTTTDVETVTVGAADDWSKTWTNLPVYEGGSAITYSVVETLETANGYTSDTTEAVVVANGGTQTITNSHTPETTSITVKKVWDDNNNQDGKRSGVVAKVKLYKKVGETTTELYSETVGAADDWSKTWTNLPVYEGGSAITYSVVETLETPNGYTSDTTEAVVVVNNGSKTITNSCTPETTSATVKKVWNDADNQDGKRPTSLTVALSDGQTVTLDESNNWTDTITDLPKYADGKEIEYTWTEDETGLPEGYSLTSNVTVDDVNEDKEVVGTITTLTNSYTPVTIDVAGAKTWDDANDQDGLRPDSITINLLADGKIIDTVEVKEGSDGTWKWQFTALPKYRDQGVEIAYSITETLDEATAAAYSARVDGYNIINTHTPATVDVTGSKIWIDLNDSHHTRPKSITIRLLADGTEIASQVVSVENNWSWSFTGLPKYAQGKTGQEVVYTVTEDSVAGYVTTQNGYSFTNTLQAVAFQKLDEQTGNPLSGAGFALYEGRLTAPSGSPLTTWTSTSAPQVLAGLTTGQTYTIFETKTPFGYITMSPFVFTVQETDTPSAMRTLTATNRHSYRFRKLSSSNSELVYDAEMAIMQGDTIIATWFTNAENDGWHYVADHRFKAGVTYTLVELTAPNGYQVASPMAFSIDPKDGFLIVSGIDTNDMSVVMYDQPVPAATPTPEPTTTTFRVTKQWEDEDNVLGLRPSSIVVNLFRKTGNEADYPDTPYLTVTMNSDGTDEWTFTFRDLPRRDSSGRLYTYMAQEEPVEGYVASYLNNGRTIVNSIPVEDLPPTPTPTLPYATPTPSPMPRVPAGVQFIDGKWVYVDEYGVPLSGVPLTGDNTNFVLWGCAIVLPLLVAALAAVEIRRRKRRMATEGREE